MQAVVDPVQTRKTLDLAHGAPLLGCRFDAAGARLFTGGQSGEIKNWRLDTSKSVTLNNHRTWVRALARDPKDRFFVSGDYDGVVCMWPVDEANTSPVRRWQAHQGWVRAAAVSPDGAIIATCGNDNLIRAWSAADGAPVRDFAGHGCHVYNMVFHPDGKHLFSCDLKGVIKQWELATGKLVRDLSAATLWKYDAGFKADIGGARGMAISADGAWLACAGMTNVSNAFAGVGNPQVVLIKLADGKATPMVPKDAFQGLAWGVVFHPSGFLAAVGNANGGGALWFWKFDQPVAFHTVAIVNGGRDLDIDVKSGRLAIAHVDGVARIYEMTPPKPA